MKKQRDILPVFTVEIYPFSLNIPSKRLHLKRTSPSIRTCRFHCEGQEYHSICRIFCQLTKCNVILI